MEDPAIALIGLGANLGATHATIINAFDALAGLANTRLVARSSLYESAPVGDANQPDFINAVAKVETTLAPTELLEKLLDIELRFGRQRSFPNAPRVLDLDLLLYGNLVLRLPALTLPHPRMHERAFVLIPLVELCPRIEIPGHGPASDLIARCVGQHVRRVEQTG